MSTYYSQVYQEQVTAITLDNSFIPDAGNFAFQNWSAGSQALSGSSSEIELYWDASGVGTGMTLVDAIYTASETYQHELDDTVFYTADGTARVVVRMTVLGNTSNQPEMYAQVQGFTA